MLSETKESDLPKVETSKWNAATPFATAGCPTGPRYAPSSFILLKNKKGTFLLC